jgi:D-ribose pyranose/furanose isomerase RbsD
MIYDETNNKKALSELETIVTIRPETKHYILDLMFKSGSKNIYIKKINKETFFNVIEERIDANWSRYYVSDSNILYTVFKINNETVISKYIKNFDSNYNFIIGSYNFVQNIEVVTENYNINDLKILKDLKKSKKNSYTQLDFETSKLKEARQEVNKYHQYLSSLRASECSKNNKNKFKSRKLKETFYSTLHKNFNYQLEVKIEYEKLLEEEEQVEDTLIDYLESEETYDVSDTYSSNDWWY